MKLKYNIAILSEAEIDLDTAYIWYETRLIGLGDRFFDSVNESVLYIARSPLIYQEIYDNVRCRVIKKFELLYNLSLDQRDGIRRIRLDTGDRP